MLHNVEFLPKEGL